MSKIQLRKKKKKYTAWIQFLKSWIFLWRFTLTLYNSKVHMKEIKGKYYLFYHFNHNEIVLIVIILSRKIIYNVWYTRRKISAFKFYVVRKTNSFKSSLTGIYDLNLVKYSMLKNWNKNSLIMLCNNIIFRKPKPLFLLAFIHKESELSIQVLVGRCFYTVETFCQLVLHWLF